MTSTSGFRPWRVDDLVLPWAVAEARHGDAPRYDRSRRRVDEVRSRPGTLVGVWSCQTGCWGTGRSVWLSDEKDVHARNMGDPFNLASALRSARMRSITGANPMPVRAHSRSSPSKADTASRS
jgi:hypothetical protein